MEAAFDNNRLKTSVYKLSHNSCNIILDPSRENVVPKITANRSTTPAITATRAVVLNATENSLGRSSSIKIGQTNLEWQTFNGSLPNGAVSIYNGYVSRTDYVAKYGSSAGFYNPDKGPYCLYPYGDKEHRGSPFEILVNKDNFEFLEWKDGSYGSVPENSVKTGSGKDVYVGKNKYGLGKVHVRHKAFFLPWEGYEYYYKYYQVLTFNKDVISENISDVKYKTDDLKTVNYPPETITKFVLTNNDCRPVKQTNTIKTSVQTEQRWDFSVSLTVGVETTITTGIPLIVSGEIKMSASTTVQYTKGKTHIESREEEVNVEQEVPPNHSCVVHMVATKYKADIPFTARVCRTYRNGETTWTSITGTYNKVQYGEFRSVVDRCEPIPGAKPCPLYR